MLVLIMDSIISPNQIAFIKDRFILKSVTTPHQVLHSVFGGKEEGAVLKLDYEGFDKVDLDSGRPSPKNRFWPKYEEMDSDGQEEGSLALAIS